MTGLVIVGAEVDSRPDVDIRIRGDTIVELGHGLTPCGERIVRARGGAVIPGLHDHHLHILALGASLTSARCGPPSVNTPDELAKVLRKASNAAGPGAWVRGVGYHESVAGPLDRWRIDAISIEHPVRIQHRSGRLWMLNGAAIRTTGLEDDAPPGAERDAGGRLTGRLFREDEWLGSRVGDSSVDLASVGRLLSSLGLSGVTDATPDLSPTAQWALGTACQSGALPQRLVALGTPQQSELLRSGPLKLVLDEYAGIDLHGLIANIAAAHAAGRAVAIHCVTRAEVVSAIAAVAATGCTRGDRLEHASELPLELTSQVRQLGLTIVTQPNFVVERGDSYVVDVEPESRGILYRCGSLIAAGIAVAGGTDAPFGSPDPWAAMRAAVGRRTRTGRVIGPDEKVSPRAALRLFLGDAVDPGGPARLVTVGAPANLCLLDCPLDGALERLNKDLVRATVINGQVVYERDDFQDGGVRTV